jgi:hypothetical protein
VSSLPADTGFDWPDIMQLVEEASSELDAGVRELASSVQDVVGRADRSEDDALRTGSAEILANFDEAAASLRARQEVLLALVDHLSVEREGEDQEDDEVWGPPWSPPGQLMVRPSPAGPAPMRISVQRREQIFRVLLVLGLILVFSAVLAALF